ncbi:FkbM family methyltransferase [Nitrosopumilus sp.]|uniref:FkbM family methyltransferase n=1 Tax=Nitrosopumilus sp. TaxID=2024843 RepID=UPI003D0D36A9
MMKKIMNRIYQKSAKLLVGTGISQNKQVRKFVQTMNSQLKPDFVELEGNKLYLDHNDSLSLSLYGYHEKTETELVKQEIKPGDVVLDVGANIGYYTLLFAKLVGPQGHVFAFEPEPKNFELLTKNVNVNGYKNVTLIQKAVSNNNEIKNFYLTNTNTISHRLSKPHNECKSIKIETISLDDFIDKHDIVNFIKIDIHGSEGNAIKGMLSILKKNETIKLLQEWWPDAIKEYDMDPEEHLRILNELGFSLYEVDDINNKIMKTSIEKLMKKYPNPKIKDINIFSKR